MRTHPVVTLVPSLLTAAVLAGCASGEAEQSTSAPPPAAVTAAEVTVRELRDWADFTGRLEAASHVDVHARVGGFVESVHFDEGGRVERGDLLFTIDPRPFEAEVARLTAERERARAELGLARAYRDRAERLLAEKATSREEFEQLEADAEVAEAAVASVEAARAAAELDLSFTRVTAPIDGRVSRAVVTAGNLVDSSTLLTTVVADDPIHAYFDVDEHTYLELIQRNAAKANAHSAGSADGRAARSEDGAPAALHGDGGQVGRHQDEGLAVFIGLANEQGYPHVARLDFVDNHVDPEQGTIRARAVLSNPDGRFTPGLFARLRVVGERTYDAALIDEKAIGTDLDRKYVLVVDENAVAQYRAVELGRSVDGLRVVTDGLDKGDLVIVNGLQRVRPGMPVAANEVPMPSDSPQIERLASANAFDVAVASSGTHGDLTSDESRTDGSRVGGSFDL
jgi:membrane fusion protein, multidrug efflux system